MGHLKHKVAGRQVKSVLQQAILTLSLAGCDTPRLDAEVILAHLLTQERSWLYAHSYDLLSEAMVQAFAEAIQRRVKRAPVAYITGEREFFGLAFEVRPAVLIPRPETELLVEQAIQLIGHRPSLVVDVGAGSGCIAIALALHCSQARLVATDISSDALHIARRNAARHGVADRLYFIQTDLLAGLKGPVDLLASNPPYISTSEMETLTPEITQYEPRLALTDGGTGLSIIAKILAEAPAIIRPGGVLLLEFGAGQGPQVLRLAQTYSPAAAFEIKPDLAGRDRLLMGRF